MAQRQFVTGLVSNRHVSDATQGVQCIDRSYMPGIERGARSLSVVKLAQIARALGVPVRDLLP